jgi:hypothetical protein
MGGDLRFKRLKFEHNQQSIEVELEGFSTDEPVKEAGYPALTRYNIIIYSGGSICPVQAWN